MGLFRPVEIEAGNSKAAMKILSPSGHYTQISTQTVELIRELKMLVETGSNSKSNAA